VASPDGLTAIGRRFDQSHTEFAERPAVTDERGTLNYRELGGRARRLASALYAQGLRGGDRVVLAAENRREWVETEHALSVSGLVRVALLPRLHPNELAHIAADCAPRAVVADGGWLRETGLGWIPASVTTVIAIGTTDELPAGVLTYDDVLAYASTPYDGALPEPEDIAAVWYTSGSTGMPKGVICTHRTHAASTRNILDVMPLRADDVAVHTAPISHWSGAIGMALVAAGGHNILRAGFDPQRLVADVEDTRATVLPLVPTQIDRLVDVLTDGPTRAAMRTVRLIPYAGSAMAPERLGLATDRLGAVLRQFYGSAEAPAPIVTLAPEDHTTVRNRFDAPRLAAAGRVYAGAEVRIEGADAPGDVGEIGVRGEAVTRGYWGADGERPADRDADGFLLTGDVGYLDDDGYLFIVDRKKDMIVTGGFNVYPREVENAIATLDGVREVAVVGAPDDRWGEAVTAFVALSPNAGVDADLVRDHCRAQIAGYKVPKRVEIVDELPKSGAGKIFKRALRDQLWSGRKRKV
jgi:acyl-CoA synthetase (AMP-forming)/AMP-acid ligase II